MNDKIIGTCSICGGPVAIPTAWMGIYPPIPSCLSCGAKQRESFGPVIDMEPPEYPRGYNPGRIDVSWNEGNW